MHQVNLADHLYNEAKQRATEAGFGSVDEFVADVLNQELHEDSENLDHLFTPEHLAHIDKAAAQVDAGQFMTSEQADAELAKRRAEWIRKNPR